MKNCYIGIGEPSDDEFFIELDITDLNNVDDFQESLMKIKNFSKIVKTEQDNIILLGFKEIEKGSIQRFISGEYSSMYKKHDPADFIKFEDAVDVLKKKKKRKKYLEDLLDVIIADEAELDSAPKIEQEIYSGNIEIL